MSTPDSIDEQLVRLLGKDARQNSELLAKQLNISAATVRRRLRRLIRTGMLHIVGAIDPLRFGLPVVVVMNIDAAYDKLESVVETLNKMPEMRWVSITTGRCDIVAVAWLRSNAALSEFLTTKLAQIEGVKSSETFICLEVRKGFYVPLV